MSNILMCGNNPIGQVCDIPATDISYDNTSSGLTADDVQAAIDEINTNKLSMGGGTLNGDLKIETLNTTTSDADSRLFVGNNKSTGTTGNSRGVLTLYDRNQYSASILAGDNTYTADRFLVLPNASGIIATVTDVSYNKTYTHAYSTGANTYITVYLTQLSRYGIMIMGGFNGHPGIGAIDIEETGPESKAFFQRYTTNTSTVDLFHLTVTYDATQMKMTVDGFPQWSIINLVSPHDIW